MPGGFLGHSGRADKQCPNRSPRTALSRSFAKWSPERPQVAAHGKARQSSVGVFRHAPIERGGGGGLWMALASEASRPIPTTATTATQGNYARRPRRIQDPERWLCAAAPSIRVGAKHQPYGLGTSTP